MPYNSVNDDYHVDTFLDMQRDLSVWLKESHDINGEWSIAEKKRFLNRGCVAVAAATLSITEAIVYEVNGVTATNEIRELDSPLRMIQPIKLFIDGYAYKELTFDQWMDAVGGFMQAPPGSISTATGQFTAFSGSRFFYWDQTKNVFQINPRITNDTTVELYAVVMPNLLVNDDEVSNLNPVFTHLASAWAAWKMLPQDEEHRDRGREAQRDYITGLRDFEKYKRMRKGNISKGIIKDQNQFGSGKGFGTLGKTDFGTTWDLL